MADTIERLAGTEALADADFTWLSYLTLGVGTLPGGEVWHDGAPRQIVAVDRERNRIAIRSDYATK